MKSFKGILEMILICNYFGNKLRNLFLSMLFFSIVEDLSIY